jgi:hypothetical protein
VLSYVHELPEALKIEPGEWEILLVRLCFKSDMPNLRALIGTFGAIPQAVWDYKNVPGGFEDLIVDAAKWEGRQ